jgi:hypothetical protein
MRSAAHPDCHNSLVVESLNAGGVIRYGFKQSVYNLGRSATRIFFDDPLDSSTPEQISLSITCVQDAIAEEDKHIAGLHAELEFVVFRLIKKTEGQTGSFYDLIFSAVHVNGTRQP